MTDVPKWLEDILKDFASGMGLNSFALNSEGVASLRFENAAVFAGAKLFADHYRCRHGAYGRLFGVDRPAS